MSPVKLGALLWSQYTGWNELLEAAQRADRLGYDTLWTWDHVMPVVGEPDGPIFEGWSTLAAWAHATDRIRLGLMVGANTFRPPALTAKLVTTLDHISNGRAILGIGSAWFEPEHLAFGIPFGSGAPERLRWLAEALPVIRTMLDGRPATSPGPRYAVQGARNDPVPVQAHLPILIGGGGVDVTLKLVARYGDANNIGGGVENVRRKDEILVRHCEAIGRDPAEIERTSGLGTVVIRDSRREAVKVQREIFERQGRAEVWADQPVGTPEDVAERILAYMDIGYRHLTAGFPGPHDEESMVRLAGEVRAMVDRAG
jgi:alkanesulfonate monooxygenase SsuD/methylene tetrahydromethanopterin reductase-like flavin-dependent oxidoreductase (luciferase family)